MHGTACGSKSEHEAAGSTWVLRVVFQNLAPHQCGLYFDYREMFRETLIIRVQ